MTPYAADPSGGCGVSVSDSGREHGFGAPRLPTLRFVRTARGSERLRPRLQRHAPRLGGVMNTGGFPGRRTGPRGPARQPPRRLLSEPPSDSMWPIVPSAGRLPARHRDYGDTALDCAFRRPRRLQPTTLPVAALWMAAPYHPVTRAARRFLLARSLRLLARRPLLPPVTTRFPNFAPLRRSGSDRRQPRPPRPRAAPTRADPRRPFSSPNDTYSACSLPSLSQSVRRARASRADLTNTRQANRRKRRLRP